MGGSRLGRRAGVACIAVLAAVAVPADAGAVTVTLGPSPLPPPGSPTMSVCGTTCTFAQASTPTAGILLGSPADGTITSWRFNGSMPLPDNAFRLRVLRPLAGGAFQAVGTSSPSSLASGASNLTSLPIRFGDRIGIDVVVPTGGFPGIRYTPVAGAQFLEWNPALAEGAAAAGMPRGEGDLQLNADVELFAPAVSAVTPATGPPSGGTRVTIVGEHFGGATEVLFGSARAGDVVVTDTQVTATAPAHPPGTVEVRVVGPGGTSVSSPMSRFTYPAPPSPPSPPPPLPPPPDTAAPKIRELALTRTRFRAANIGGSVPARAKVGTRVFYRVSEAGTAIFSAQRRTVARGRRACGRKRKRCVRYRPVRGGFRLSSTAGFNAFTFTGRVRRKALRPGRYRLTLVASDAAGNRSKPASRPFRIVR